MLGVAILLGLALWFIIVCLATFLPLKLIENKLVASIFAFIGFMLTFGYWWLDMMIEGNRAYQAGVEACKQAKITIYVQPEKWIKMVGGYEAWKKLGYDSKSKLYMPENEKAAAPDYLDFEGVRYPLNGRSNARVLSYWLITEDRLSIWIYYDKESKMVLYKSVSFLGNANHGLTAANLLGIRNGHTRCDSDEKGESPFRSFYFTFPSINLY